MHSLSRPLSLPSAIDQQRRDSSAQIVGHQRQGLAFGAGQVVAHAHQGVTGHVPVRQNAAARALDRLHMGGDRKAIVHDREHIAGLEADAHRAG